MTGSAIRSKGERHGCALPGACPLKRCTTFWGLVTAYWVSDRWREAWTLTVVVLAITALISKAAVWTATASADFIASLAEFHRADTGEPARVILLVRAGLFRHLLLPLRRPRLPPPDVDDAAPPGAPLARRPLRRRDPLRPAHRPRPDERPRLRRQGHPAARLHRPAPRHLHRPPLRRPDRPRHGLLRRRGVHLVRLGGAGQPQPADRIARPGRRRRESAPRIAPRPGDRRPHRPRAGRLRHRAPRRRPRGALRAARHPLRLAGRPRRPAPHPRAAEERRRLARRARLDAEPGRARRRLARPVRPARHQQPALRRHRPRLAPAERLGRDDADVHRGLQLPVAAPARLPAGAPGVHGRQHDLPRLRGEPPSSPPS